MTDINTEIPDLRVRQILNRMEKEVEKQDELLAQGKYQDETEKYEL